MDNRTVDETGNRHGKWTVLSHAGRGPQPGTYWLCLCDCGNEKYIRGIELRSGNSSSCGQCTCHSTSHMRRMSAAAMKDRVCVACDAPYRSNRKTDRFCRKCSYTSHNLKKSGIKCSVREHVQAKRNANGKCDGCEVATLDLHVDHNHNTGAIRGVLCHECNVTEGYFKSDYSRLLRLYDYCIRNQAS